MLQSSKKVQEEFSSDKQCELCGHEKGVVMFNIICRNIDWGEAMKTIYACFVSSYTCTCLELKAFV